MKRNRRAGVEDRWTKADGTPSASQGKGLRWRARYVDDSGKEHACGFGRKADAQKWIDEVTAAVVTGSYVDPALGATTFGSFYRDWSARQVWTSGTRTNMDLVMRSVPFGDVPLADLRVSHLESWVAAMAEGFAASTVRSRFANVRTVLRAAVGDRCMPRDITARVRLPRTRKVSAAMRIPTVAQVAAVMAAAEPQFAALIALAAFAGLRLGEASAVRVSDVDFLHRELHIRRQVQWTDDGRAEVRAPKYGSERTIAAPDGLLSLLAEHIRRFRPGTDGDRWLFPNLKDGGVPMHASMVAYQWRAAREAAGISYRLHDLRHFFASGLINAGCSVVTVQRCLGHSNATTTLNTYSHLWPDANDQTRRAAGELFSAALGATSGAATAT